jgi:hypothetical protein
MFRLWPSSAIVVPGGARLSETITYRHVIRSLADLVMRDFPIMLILEFSRHAAPSVRTTYSRAETSCGNCESGLVTERYSLACTEVSGRFFCGDAAVSAVKSASGGERAASRRSAQVNAVDDELGLARRGARVGLHVEQVVSGYRHERLNAARH